MFIVHVVQVHVFTFLLPCYDFRVKMVFGSSLFQYIWWGFLFYLGYLYQFTYILVSKMILYDITLISFNSHTMGTIRGAAPAYRSDAHEFDSCFCRGSYCTNFSCLFSFGHSSACLLIIPFISSKCLRHF